jgi:ubiquinone/menaquinone biosynthesis C-methylase UbiE
VRRPEFIARQSSHPSGIVGRILARIMAAETASLNLQALDLLALRTSDHVLEIGFGHGKTLGLAAARVPHGFVAGVDVSEAMVVMARRRCKAAIRCGLVEVKVGDSSRLFFPDESFDKAFSIHTLYFWNEPIRDLREICRVLKPGGRFVLGFRAKCAAGSPAEFPQTVYTFYSTAEICRLLESAGFDRIEIRSASISPAEIFLVAAHRQPAVLVH